MYLFLRQISKNEKKHEQSQKMDSFRIAFMPYPDKIYIGSAFRALFSSQLAHFWIAIQKSSLPEQFSNRTSENGERENIFGHFSF
jgi:hypothetical protein